VRYVTPDEGLMLITQEGMIIRLNVSNVREVGRSAQGVKLMNLDPEDRIVAVAKLAEKDEETEIELAKVEGAPVPAELELEAADSEDGTLDDTGELALLDDGEFDAGEAGDEAADDDEDETVH
jgi:DNA gyrase subunit A